MPEYMIFNDEIVSLKFFEYNIYFFELMNNPDDDGLKIDFGMIVLFFFLVK